MKYARAIALTIAPAFFGLGACVSMPDFDKSAQTPAEFQAEIDALDDYPVHAQTPQTPDDIRSSAQWDRDARAVMALQAEFNAVEAIKVPTSAQTLASREQLLTQLNAYKLDDPE